MGTHEVQLYSTRDYYNQFRGLNHFFRRFLVALYGPKLPLPLLLTSVERTVAMGDAVEIIVISN